MAFALAQEKGWLLLDKMTCIYDSFSGPRVFGNPSSETVSVSFDVRWNSSGSFLIQANTSYLPKMRKMMNILTIRNYQNHVGTPVLLLPLGLKGIFHGFEQGGEHRKATAEIRKLKAVIGEFFRGLSIHLSESIKWFRVSTSTPSRSHALGINNPDVVRSKAVSFVWPADHCVLRIPEDEAASTEDPAIFYNGILDPIQRAQAWYNSRFDRLKAVEAEKRRLEMEAEVSKRSQIFVEQNPLGGISPTEHRMATQDASAVYPTPPDGVHSTNHDTPMQGDMTGIDHEVVDDDGYGFSDQANQDLFGENDMGLTEADFEFFDDSNANKLPMRGPDDAPFVAMSRGSSNAGLHQASSTDTSEVNNDMDGSSISGKGIKSKGALTMMALDRWLIPPADHPVQSTSHSLSLEAARSPGIETDTITQLAAANQAHGAVVQGPYITKEDSEPEIDSKYSIHGRFAYGATEKTAIAHIKPMAPIAATEIPEIGLLEGSASDSEESTEIGERAAL